MKVCTYADKCCMYVSVFVSRWMYAFYEWTWMVLYSVCMCVRKRKVIWIKYTLFKWHLTGLFPGFLPGGEAFGKESGADSFFVMEVLGGMGSALLRLSALLLERPCTSSQSHWRHGELYQLVKNHIFNSVRPMIISTFEPYLISSFHRSFYIREEDDRDQNYYIVERIVYLILLWVTILNQLCMQCVCVLCDVSS